MIHIIILSADKRLACVVKAKKCRICGHANSSYFHMKEKHQDVIDKHRQNMRNEFDKEISGWQDREQLYPWWTYYGSKI